MASKTEKDNLITLATSKGFNVFHSGNVINTPNSFGTFHVYSPNGKPFKANMDLTSATNYLNTF